MWRNLADDIAHLLAVPRFHFGRPTNPGALRFWQTDGTGEQRVFQNLKLKWWCGLSSRRRPRWFLGVMSWDRTSEF